MQTKEEHEYESFEQDVDMLVQSLKDSLSQHRQTTELTT